MDDKQLAFLIEAAGNVTAALIQIFKGMGNDAAAAAVDAAVREHSHATWQAIQHSAESGG